jgi:hypothetical protein
VSLRELGWPTLAVLFFALVCLVLTLFSGSVMGGFEYWPLSAIGISLLIYELVQNRRWWLLAALPFLAAPVFMMSVLFLACLGGDCL